MPFSRLLSQFVKLLRSFLPSYAPLLVVPHPDAWPQFVATPRLSAPQPRSYLRTFLTVHVVAAPSQVVTTLHAPLFAVFYRSRPSEVPLALASPLLARPHQLVFFLQLPKR